MEDCLCLCFVWICDGGEHGVERSQNRQKMIDTMNILNFRNPGMLSIENQLSDGSDFNNSIDDYASKKSNKQVKK